MNATKEELKNQAKDKRNKQKVKKTNQNITFEILASVTSKRR